MLPKVSLQCRCDEARRCFQEFSLFNRCLNNPTVGLSSTVGTVRWEGNLQVSFNINQKFKKVVINWSNCFHP